MSTYFIQKEAKYDTNPGAPTATTAQIVELLNRVSEHFGCFVLYAYDFNGNPLKLGVQTSHMEDCALRSLVKGDALGEIEMCATPLAAQGGVDEFDEFNGFDDLDEWDDVENED